MRIAIVILTLTVSALVAVAQPTSYLIQWPLASNVPQNKPGLLLTNISSLATGEAHYLALGKDGTVLGWGWNNFGQATGIRYGSEPEFVKTDGQILSNVTAIAAGRTCSIALKSDGSVLVWGASNAGRKLPVPADLTNAVAVTAGWDECLVLRNDGTALGLTASGPYDYGQSNLVGIAAGQQYGFGSRPGKNLGVTRDGTVMEFDSRSSTQLYLKELTNVASVAVSGNARFALTKDRRVFEIGVNGHVVDKIASIAAGQGFALVIRDDSTVVAFGKLGAEPASVPAGLSNIVAVAIGRDSCLAITTNRAVAERFMPKGK